MNSADAFGAAVELRRLGGELAAIPAFEALLEFDKNNQDVIIHLAECLKATGSVGRARQLFESLLSLDCDNVSALMHLALLAHDRGEHDLKLSLLERAYRSGPLLIWPKIHWALELRGRGRFDHALAVLREALSIDANHLIVLREIGLTLLRLNRIIDNRLDEAIEMFSRALDIDPLDLQTRIELCASLRYSRRFAEAKALFAEPNWQGDARVQFELVMTDIIEFPEGRGAGRLEAMLESHADEVVNWLSEGVRECLLPEDPFGLGARLYIRQHMGFDETHISPTDVKNIVLDAIRCGRPFSLLRAADGEGAILAHAQRHEPGPLGQLPGRLSGAIMGHQIWRTWTGFPVSCLSQDELDIIRRDLELGFATADIVGIPQIGPLVGFAANYIDLHGQVEAHRFVSGVCRAEMAAAPINVLLYKEGAYDIWLQDVRRLGVITCHAGLAESMAKRFNITDVIEHVVPFQKGFAEIFGYNAATEKHFPIVYEKLRREISKDADGRVYLVAAGVFGKSYCSWIKLAGGIGLDMGAMADAFAGFNTRPTIAALVDSL